MFKQMTHTSDWVHLLVGILIGYLGPVGWGVVYMVVHREYIQEQEKREINRAGFDLQVWMTGITVGHVMLALTIALALSLWQP